MTAPDSTSKARYIYNNTLKTATHHVQLQLDLPVLQRLVLVYLGQRTDNVSERDDAIRPQRHPSAPDYAEAGRGSARGALRGRQLG
jgi:hypothetical protein